MFIIGSVVFLSHLVACFWFLLDKSMGFDDSGWVYGGGFFYSDILTQYQVAFHWAFQTLTTVGYGDISAHTWWEHIFAILWMIFGVGFYSYMVGNII